MKRFLVILLVACVLLPVLAAHGQDDAPVVVTWWATERGRDTAATRELHFQLARAFEAENPGVQVAVSLYPSRGFATRIVTAIAAGQGPDIWYHYYATDIAAQGFLEDLTPYIEASGLDTSQWFDSAARRAVYQDRYYGVPRDAVSGFIAYNKDIFDAAGVAYPEDGWTVSDYRDLAIQLTNPETGTYGAGGIEGGEGCMLWSPFSFNLGAEITSPDGRQVAGYMDTPEAINAMNWCLSLVTEDQVTAPADMADQFGEQTFNSGVVAMQSLSDWEIPALMEQSFNWGVVAPPRFDENTDVIPWADSYVYYMWNGSQHKDAAWKLLEWLTGPTAQRMAAEAGVWSPNSPAVWEELGWNEDPIKSVSYNQLVNSTLTPNYLRSQFFFDCPSSTLADIRTRWIEGGERDLQTMMTEGTAAAQQCLDDSYAALPQ